MARATDIAVSSAEPHVPAASAEVGAEVRLFAALANPIRLDMVRELAINGEVCGCGFRVRDRVSQPTVSHHLRVLREAGLIHCTRERSYLRYRLDPDALARGSAIVDDLRAMAARPLTDAPMGDSLLGCCGRFK